MVALLIQLSLAIRWRLTRRARLETENLILRQQLVILRRKFPRRVETVEHRSLADGVALSTVPVASGRDHHRTAGDRDPLAPTRVPRLLALEVPPCRRPSADLIQKFER